MKKSFQLETERLYLRELSIVDASFILQLMNAPNWLQYIGDRHVRTKSDAANYISKKIITSYRNNGFGLYLMQLKEVKLSIGICGLVQRDGLDAPDIGFAILPEFENKGYISEAIQITMKFAFDDLELEVVQGITTLDNAAAIRLLENAGMIYKMNIKLPESDKEFMLFSTK